MRRRDLLLILAGSVLLWGCVAKKPKDQEDTPAEESLVQMQPGFMKSVKKLGIRFPERKTWGESQFTPAHGLLAEALEMELAQDVLSYGGFQVVSHQTVAEFVKSIKDRGNGTAGQNEDERYLGAIKACGLDAYVELDVKEFQSGQKSEAGGCLFPGGSSKFFCQMAGRAYMVDVATGAIVGVNRFQYRHEGKLSKDELEKKVVEVITQDLCAWIRESP